MQDMLWLEPQRSPMTNGVRARYYNTGKRLVIYMGQDVRQAMGFKRGESVAVGSDLQGQIAIQRRQTGVLLHAYGKMLALSLSAEARGFFPENWTGEFLKLPWHVRGEQLILTVPNQPEIRARQGSLRQT